MQPCNNAKKGTVENTFRFRPIIKVKILKTSLDLTCNDLITKNSNLKIEIGQCHGYVTVV